VHALLRILPGALVSIFGVGAPTPPAAGATVHATAGGDWVTFQGDNARTGVAAGARSFHGLHRRFARRLDGQVYGQPLIAGGRVYVATENNSVYAFTTGGRQVFRRNFGRPVPKGDLPCGNIDPTGITGTPAIAGNRIYAVTYQRAGHKHVLVALDTSSGAARMRKRVDPPNPIVQQERGALLVDHGRVYVPYGGLDGDCGPYHGYLVSVTTRGGGRRTFRTPSGEAGIWSPGGESEERDGSLLATTGNGSGPGFGLANSVVRLSPTLSRRGFWAPADWADLSGSDTDVGSISPLPLPGGGVFQSGKNGVGYVLGPRLGGVGRELSSTHVCDAAFGAAALAGSTVLVPCTDRLVALRLSGNRLSVAWSDDGKAGTPVVAGDSVLYVQDQSKLRVVGLSNGSERASQDLGSNENSFPSPGVSGDLVVAPAGDSIVGYGA
jgi:outer membrane protein assembly factor BamB